MVKVEVPVIAAYQPRNDTTRFEKRSREMKRGEEEGYRVRGRSEQRVGLMFDTRFDSPSCHSSSKDVGQLIIPTRFFVAFSSFLSARAPTVSGSSRPPFGSTRKISLARPGSSPNRKRIGVVGRVPYTSHRLRRGLGRFCSRSIGSMRNCDKGVQGRKTRVGTRS